MFAALMRHRQELSEIISAGENFLQTSDISDRFSYAAQIVAALGPVVEDFVVGPGGDSVVMAAADDDGSFPLQAVSDAGLSIDQLEKLLPILVQLASILIAVL
jgi:hypothetical protein